MDKSDPMQRQAFILATAETFQFSMQVRNTIGEEDDVVQIAFAHLTDLAPSGIATVENAAHTMIAQFDIYDHLVDVRFIDGDSASVFVSRGPYEEEPE
jgi:predicted component of type VI protein secretion system